MGKRMSLVFDIDVRTWHGNPHLADTPFGRATIVHDGDLAAECDEWERRYQELLGAAEDVLATIEITRTDVPEDIHDAVIDLRKTIERHDQ